MYLIFRKIKFIITHLWYFGIADTISMILVVIFGKPFFSLRDKTILKFLKKRFKSQVEKYKTTNYPDTNISDQAPIWTFWAQGVDSMPPIGKKCLEMVHRHSNGREVIVLDMNNFKDYIEIPDTIIKKTEQGIIKLQHFSDLVRCTLLEKFGGIWIDACILLTRDIPHIENCFFTAQIIRPGYFYSGKWVIGFQGATPHNPMHAYAKEILTRYYMTDLPLINYLLLDYMLLLAYNEIPSIKQMVDKAPKNIVDFHYTSRNRYNHISDNDFHNALSKNMILRASYKWEKAKDEDMLYWKIFNI